MTNATFNTLSDFRDTESITVWNLATKLHFPRWLKMKLLRATSRDNARTPMQWDDSPQAGFSTTKPWLPVNPNYQTINVAKALADKNSLFYTYQALIKLRKEEDWLVDADYELLETSSKVFAYLRKTTDKTYLVLVNLSDETQSFTSNYTIKDTIITNTKTPQTLENLTLEPWDAFCLEVD